MQDHKFKTSTTVQQHVTRKDFNQNPEKIRSPKSVKYRENPVLKMQNPDINKIILYEHLQSRHTTTFAFHKRYILSS